jgi:hypothetical protein
MMAAGGGPGIEARAPRTGGRPVPAAAPAAPGPLRQPRLRDQGRPGAPGYAIEVARSTRRTRRAGRVARQVMTGRAPGGDGPGKRATGHRCPVLRPGLTSPQT